VFRFTGQTGVAAGVRRIEAWTGPAAYAGIAALDARLASLAEMLKAQPDQVGRRIEQLLAERDKLEAKVAELREKGAGASAGDLTEVSVDGITVSVGETDLEDRAEVTASADRFRQGRAGSILVLFAPGGRGAIHVAVTDDLVGRGKKAGDLVNRIASVSGGKGGGRPTFASASAGDVGKLPMARAALVDIVAAWLAS